MRTRTDATVLYVNYAPYDDSGKILTYLTGTFRTVYHFSLGFHVIGGRRSNVLMQYERGRPAGTKTYTTLHLPKGFVFLLLPVTAVTTFLHILLVARHIRNRGKLIDLYFSVNAFTASIGNLLKRAGTVRRTVFWVWDYYPPGHGNPVVSIMRSIYWQFDKLSVQSDTVAFVSRKLKDVWRRAGLLQNSAEYPIVPIGSDRLPYRYTQRYGKKRPLTLGFIGVLKRSQGLDIIFDNADRLTREFGTVRLEIVGTGPDEEYFRGRARDAGMDVRFRGYLPKDTYNTVLAQCHIGLATYVPDASNVSLYGDPGKIKRYLSLGIPVITTEIPEISGSIAGKGAGSVIRYDRPEELVNAIRKILSDHRNMSRRAYAFGREFDYRRVYPVLFYVL